MESVESVLIKSRWAHLFCTPISILIYYCSNLQNKTLNIDLFGWSFVLKKCRCETTNKRRGELVVIRQKGNQKTVWVHASFLLISTLKSVNACYRVQVVFRVNPWLVPCLRRKRRGRKRRRRKRRGRRRKIQHHSFDETGKHTTVIFLIMVLCFISSSSTHQPFRLRKINEELIRKFFISLSATQLQLLYKPRRSDWTLFKRNSDWKKENILLKKKACPLNNQRILACYTGD